MASRDRLENIRQIVKLEKRVVVSELSKEFDVTEETIRRDLEKLEREGLVARTYGGAVLNMDNSSERISFLRRSQTNVAEKRDIARIIAGIIPERATIGADASSTVMEAISMMRDRSDVMVLTNSTKIVRELDQAEIGIMSTGGLINKNSYSLQGVIARNTLMGYHVDIVLVSCKGLLSDGIFDSDENEAELKKILISRGQKVFLLVDHTKFGKIAFVKLMDLSQIDTLITDREPGREWLEIFRKNGVDVLYPGMMSE